MDTNTKIVTREFLRGKTVDEICEKLALSREQVEEFIRRGFDTPTYLHIDEDGVSFCDAKSESCFLHDEVIEGEREPVLVLGMDDSLMTIGYFHAHLLRSLLAFWLSYAHLPVSQEELKSKGFLLPNEKA